MVTFLTIIGIILAIPVALIVAWKLLGFIWAIISDLAGIIFAIIVVAIISLIVMAIL